MCQGPAQPKKPSHYITEISDKGDHSNSNHSYGPTIHPAPFTKSNKCSDGARWHIPTYQQRQQSQRTCPPKLRLTGSKTTFFQYMYIWATNNNNSLIIVYNYPNRGLMLPSLPLGCTKVPINGVWESEIPDCCTGHSRELTVASVTHSQVLFWEETCILDSPHA